MSKLVLLSNIKINAKASRQMMDEIEHLVLPVIAIKEGVLNNILYPASELAECFEAWNGVPVPVGHPMDGETALTANSVTCEDTVNIGRFYNVKFENNSVKGEIWINIPKAEKLGYSCIINGFEDGEMMEVSTGLVAFTREENGEFNGVPYTNVIDTIRPDHLALLPNETGACSIEDGCGAMRTNKAKGGSKWLNKFRTFFGLNVGESFQDKENAVRVALREAYGKNSYSYPYILNVYDTYVIFELGPSLYKQTYTLDGNTNAILQGDKIEVRAQVDYVPVTNKTEINNMDPNKKMALVSALALAMVANNAAAVTDESKVTLAAMPDAMLTNMAGQYKLNEDGTSIVETPATPATTPATVNASTDAPLSGPERLMLANLMKAETTRLANKRTQVVEMHDHVTETIANAMDEVALDALLAVNGEQVANYAPAGGTVTPNGKEPYKAPSVFLKANTEGGKA